MKNLVQIKKEMLRLFNDGYAYDIESFINKIQLLSDDEQEQSLNVKAKEIYNAIHGEDIAESAKSMLLFFRFKDGAYQRLNPRHFCILTFPDLKGKMVNIPALVYGKRWVEPKVIYDVMIKGGNTVIAYSQRVNCFTIKDIHLLPEFYIADLLYRYKECMDKNLFNNEIKDDCDSEYHIKPKF